jgi:heterodisulfide reductase subunit B
MENEELQYSGNVRILHFLEVLRDFGWDKIKECVKKPLKNLKVAPYYGCLLLRPRGIGVDDSDHPTIMEELFEALGAEVVDSPYKQKCCGSYHAIQLKEVVADLSYRVLKYSKEAGADLLATACPLCEFNLGSRQYLIEKKYPDFEPIPVVYFTQLMSLAFGLDEEVTDFKSNNPDPRPLLFERGLLEEEKF